MSRGIMLLALVAASLVLGCRRGDGTTVTPTGTLAPTPTAAAPASPTRNAPTPSVTPVRLPSYRDDTQGFAIEVPDTWSTERGGQDGPALKATGPGGLPVLFVTVDFEQEDASLEKRSSSYISSLREQVEDFKAVNEGPTTLDDGTPAYATEFTYTQRDKQTLQGFATVVAHGLKTFRIEAVSTTANFALTKATIQSVIRSFVAYTAKPYGVDLAQAIVVAGDNPKTLDPHLSQDMSSHQYVVLVYSGLLTIDKDLRLQLDLADTWSVSDDGTTYTFTLRQRAQFQDGRRVTADDVKYSLERATDRDTASPTAATYLGDIVGVREKLAGAARSISGVQVVDDRTVRIQVDGPKAYFLAKLAYPTAFVVDRYQVERGGEWWRSPNGTGPFSLTAYERDQVLVFQRNDRFYTSPPPTRHLVFRLFQGVPVRMYEAGEIDATEVGLADLERVRDPGNPLSKQLAVTPQLTVNYLGFNARVAPFDNPDVRRAFAMALDRDRMMQAVFRNAVHTARGLLPPGMPGYVGDVRGIPYDPAAARALLQRVYPDISQMPKVTYTACGRGPAGPIESAAVDLWRTNLGVDVEVVLLEPENCTEELQSRPGNVFAFGWVADYPDPENVLDVLFHSGMNNNLGGYANAEVDRLLEEARVIPDVSDRLRTYAEIERILLEDVAAAPLYHDRSYLLVKPHLKDFTVNAQGLYSFSTARLEGKTAK